MHYQYLPYLWPLSASAFVSLALGIYALLRHRNTKGATSFILSMIVVTIWSAANALEMAGLDFQTKLFWANILLTVILRLPWWRSVCNLPDMIENSLSFPGLKTGSFVDMNIHF
jgi:hypothetical protein